MLWPLPAISPQATLKYRVSHAACSKKRRSDSNSTSRSPSDFHMSNPSQHELQPVDSLHVYKVALMVHSRSLVVAMLQETAEDEMIWTIIVY
eukprot:6204837-Pleurochrysis_carterae.AAC.1